MLPPHTELIRSLREPCEALDFTFLLPMEFLLIIHALDPGHWIHNTHKFLAPEPDFPWVEELEFLIFATLDLRSMVAPATRVSDPVAKAVTEVDDRGVVKEASSFCDSALAHFSG